MAEQETVKLANGKTPVAAAKPAWEDYGRCVHCGLCLNQCPTYRLDGLEADSPRGRIRQMLLVEEGKLAIGDSFVRHIDSCLDCRACESACPSGVEYGRLVEYAREQIENNYPRPLRSHLARWLFLRHLLPHPHRIAAAARFVQVYQRTGLQALARRSGVLRALGLAERERLLPPIDGRFFFSQLGKTFPARGKLRARVALFAGCVAQVTFTALHEATIRVLTANGCEVVVPRHQLCCGALALHAGVRETARVLARKNIESFLREKPGDIPGGTFDAIIVNAAGCGSTLKEYAGLALGSNGADTWEDSARVAAEAFSAKVRDVTEFLAELGLVAPLRMTPLRVTYQDSCHLAHAQKIREAPRKLIRAVPGVEFVEMPLSDICCGSAGIYNVTETENSLRLLEEKMRYASSTNAKAIVTANPGCILQLRAGAAIHSTGQEVLHVVELLDRAMKPARKILTDSV
jgi:glycolate oxidase iron-sulfur subunit